MRCADISLAVVGTETWDREAPGIQFGVEVRPACLIVRSRPVGLGFWTGTAPH